MDLIETVVVLIPGWGWFLWMALFMERQSVINRPSVRDENA